MATKPRTTTRPPGRDVPDATPRRQHVQPATTNLSTSPSQQAQPTTPTGFRTPKDFIEKLRAGVSFKEDELFYGLKQVHDNPHMFNVYVKMFDDLNTPDKLIKYKRVSYQFFCSWVLYMCL